MDQPVELHFDITLQNLCLLQIGKSFWETDEARQEIEHFFRNPQTVHDDMEPIPIRWAFLTKRILEPIKHMTYPENLKKPLRHVTNFVGWRIFQWTQYLVGTLKFDISCSKDIILTNCGRIDKLKIFQVWIEKGVLDVTELFNVACIFCLEEYIPVLWRSMPLEKKRTEFYTGTIYTVVKYNLIAYWKSYICGDVQGEFISAVLRIERAEMEGREAVADNDHFGLLERREMSILFIFSDANRIEENMFRLAVYEGMELAVKYFWKKLTLRQRKRHIYYAIQIASRKCTRLEYTDILLFLMSKVTLKENIDLCFKSNNAFEMLLLNRPYEGFFMAILNGCLGFMEILEEAELKRSRVLSRIYLIVTMMKYDQISYDTLEEGRYQEIFQYAWRRLPETYKICLVETSDWLLLSRLLHLEDFKSLKLIINHPTFRKGTFSKRRAMILCMKTLFEKLVGKRKVYLEDKFADEIGLDENERINLRIDLFNG